MTSPTLKQALQDVESKLRQIIHTDVEVLQDASHHTISAGGKRLRPRLSFLAYQLCGGQNLNQVIPLAAAIELVHTATLVHDDINDHSLTRRGQVSVHARWGRTFALLTGDFLFTKVYELMAPYGTDYNVIMSKACVSLVEGETLQAAAAKSGKMERETYKKIISRKTASLFAAGTRMGAMLGGGDEATVAALSSFGHYLGLTFQIVDDILDIVGDSEKLGKPVGVDARQGRGVMVPNIEEQVSKIGVENAGISTLENYPVIDMMTRLRQSGAVEVARSQAGEMANRARSALLTIPPSSCRDELELIIDQVMARDR